MSTGRAAGAIVNAMTIDVEEYFHANVFDGTPTRLAGDQLESRVRRSTDRVLSLLADANVRASFFVLGSVADRHPDLVKAIARAGHEIASHGQAHQLVFDQTPAVFREDVRRAKGTLESLTGAEVQGYRAPSYSVTTRSLWALDVLADEGFRYDASVFPIHHDRYGIPGAPRHAHAIERGGATLIEAPPSTVRVGGLNLPVAGGGYFRLLPYAWTTWGIGRLNSVECKPAIFYIHPWEMDAEQPRLPLSRASAWRHYANLTKTEGRFTRLLRDFQFAPLCVVLDALGHLPGATDVAAPLVPGSTHRVSVGTSTSSIAAPAVVAPVVASHPEIHLAADARPDDWNAYVNGHANATVYHLMAWRGVFERAFGHRSEYLSARRHGSIVGVLPLVEMRSWLFGKFMVSLPFVNYGGLLADDDHVAVALFEHAGRLAKERGLSHVELRHLTQRFPAAPSKRHKVTMKMALAPDAEAMWGLLDRKVRNQIRKAEKSDLVCQIGGKELIDAFYPVFATNMRDLGTPVYAKRFFEEIFAAFPDETTMFVVRASDGAAVAGGIGLRYRDTLEMPWASSLKAYRAMCPNNLLYWSAIKQAIAGGCRTFDFGRSTPNEGTYNFKQQWGAEPDSLCWEYRFTGKGSMPDQSPKNPKFSLAIELWKRLPVSVAGVLGPPIVRSIP